MPKRSYLLVLLAVSQFLAGCAGTPKPQLTPIGEVIPADVSLAGRWQLQGTGDKASREIRNAEHSAAGGLDDVIAPARRERGGNSGRGKKGPSVHVFLETGSRLKITQNAYGLFISFDRSVVEEYRYREHRVISVGPIEAERISGWRDGHYEIQTLDEEGALLTETYALEQDGQVLVRTIMIEYKDKQTLSVRQLFDRLD